jgi:class 3 adenylate cyclase/DNA-binding winged helix-turn-helix (wHTH) protein
MQSQTELVFDPFRLDATNERLLRDGKEIRLTPKAFALLRYLAEHSDQLITKEVLLKTLWADVSVTDAVLTVCIGEIRKALGDKPNKPKFVETVHRRGFRFLSPVCNGSQNSAAIAKQDIRFCSTADGVRIAYSTMGQGPPLVIPPQFVTHLEADLVEGPLADVYEALARHHTLVRFDMRGTGLSDREVSLSSEELFLLDLETVVNELRLQRFPLYGLCEGGRLALSYYTKHPSRVSHLVFYGTNPQASSDKHKKQRNIALSVMRASWEVGSKLSVERLMPHGGTREDVERLARWVRLSVTCEASQKLMELRQNRDDLAPILAKVLIPTLVVHRRGDHVPFAGGRELASRIPGARFLPLEGYNHIPATHDEAMELVTPVVEFLAEGYHETATRAAEANVPVTLLFTDIEASNMLNQRLGDQTAQMILQAHSDAVRRAIESYNGKEVRHTGKGIGASFYSASRAIGCALHIQHEIAKRNAVNPEDAVKLRIGLNAGEPTAGNNGLSGVSAQLTRQICEMAEPGQVLVSDLVRELVAGKGFTFEPVAVKTVKGFKEPVALFKLRVE